jgi:hypothetical protein
MLRGKTKLRRAAKDEESACLLSTYKRRGNGRNRVPAFSGGGGRGGLRRGKRKRAGRGIFVGGDGMEGDGFL